MVILEFTGAGVMKYQSFQAWDESPVNTTIETKPIADITFPKVTVCPPKNTYTDLNYDLIMTENMTLKNGTIKELKDLALKLYDQLYDNIMHNLSKVYDPKRYYNLYHGLTEIELPFHSSSFNFCW